MSVRLRTWHVWLPALLAAAAVVPWSSARDGRRLEPDDVVGLARVSDPQISPDGQRVAYVVTRPGEGRKPESRVWIAPAEGGGPAEDAARGPATAPRWSPDGGRLAFVVPGKLPQVVVRGAGGASQTVLTAPDALRDLRWSPDGTSLAYLQVEPETAEAARRRAEGRDARVVGQDERHTRLHVLDLGSRASRSLTPDGLTVWRFSWSPDGRSIALLASAQATAEGQEYRSELIVVDVRSGERRVVVRETNPHAAPAFSRDGRSIAYLGPLGTFTERGIVKIVSIDGGRVVERLADDPGNVWDVIWRPGGDTLLAAVARGSTHHLVPVAADGPARPLLEMDHSITPYWDACVTVSADGRRAAFLSETPDRLEEVWTAELDGGGRRRVSDAHHGLSAVALGRVEAVSWTNAADRANVNGIVVWPPGAKAGTRLPLVTILHGGPAYNWGLGAQLRNWAQLFASRGYLVLLPNFRGSSGSGMGWLTANVRNWGDGPLGDVLSGVDHLVARGWADGDRLFVGGGSYGGYLTSWTVTHSDRFKAAWVTAGVSDLTTEFALTDEPSFLVGYFGATPFDDPDVYRSQSPLSHAARARTPTLILHGEQDLRVPVSQAYQLYAAFKHHRVTSRLVVYPREGHSIREPAHQVDAMERVLGWLAEHGGLRAEGGVP